VFFVIEPALQPGSGPESTIHNPHSTI
jgi:hypothetical protein